RESPGDTGIKCTNCHHPHGADKYQGKDSGERMTKRVEEELCLGCHDKPISVNNWNIDEQFGRRSAHAVKDTTTKDGLKGAKVECSSCHNPHVAERGVGFADVKRLVDPTNTFKQWEGQLVDFCLKCHQSENTPKKTGTKSRFVPYTIEFPDVTKILSPFFPGWDKTEFKASGHGTKGFQCNKCHMPHGSPNTRLNGLFVGDGQEFKWPTPVNVVETYALDLLTTSFDNNFYEGPSTTAKFGQGAQDSIKHRAFLRFKLTIPKGSTIKTASIKNLESLNDTPETFPTTIRLIDADSAPDFSLNPWDLTVTGQVDWLVGAWTTGGSYNTPDITALVKTYIKKAGYQSGNFMGVRIDEGTAVANQVKQFGGASIQLEVNYDKPSKTVPKPESD
ncbi:hypothetical protein LCGC14_2881220, partial [marine sediment metagenome]